MNMKRQPDPQPSPSRPQPSAAGQPTTPAGQQPPRPVNAPKTAQPQHPLQPQLVQRPRSLPPTTARAVASTDEVKKDRLFSLDAYRGFVMIVLAAAGFGILQLSKLPEGAAGVAASRLCHLAAAARVQLRPHAVAERL